MTHSSQEDLHPTVSSVSWDQPDEVIVSVG